MNTVPDASVISDDFARALAVAGTEEECLRRLSDLVNTGPDRITLTLLSGGREDRLEQLARVCDEAAFAAKEAR